MLTAVAGIGFESKKKPSRTRRCFQESFPSAVTSFRPRWLRGSRNSLAPLPPWSVPPRATRLQSEEKPLEITKCCLFADNPRAGHLERPATMKGRSSFPPPFWRRLCDSKAESVSLAGERITWQCRECWEKEPFGAALLFPGKREGPWGKDGSARVWMEPQPEPSVGTQQPQHHPRGAFSSRRI